jgi:hypothetical protein
VSNRRHNFHYRLTTLRPDHGWLLYPFVSLQSLIEEGCGLGEGKWKQWISCAFARLRVKSCGHGVRSERLLLIDARCFDGKLVAFMRCLAMVMEGTGVLGSACLSLNCTYFCEKVQAVNCETDSIRVTFPSMSSLMSEIGIISLRSSEPRGLVWLLPALFSGTISLSVHVLLK